MPIPQKGLHTGSFGCRRIGSGLRGILRLRSAKVTVAVAPALLVLRASSSSWAAASASSSSSSSSSLTADVFMNERVKWPSVEGVPVADDQDGFEDGRRGGLALGNSEEVVDGALNAAGEVERSSGEEEVDVWGGPNGLKGGEDGTVLLPEVAEENAAAAAAAAEAVAGKNGAGWPTSSEGGALPRDPDNLDANGCVMDAVRWCRSRWETRTSTPGDWRRKEAASCAQVE